MTFYTLIVDNKLVTWAVVVVVLVLCIFGLVTLFSKRASYRKSKCPSCRSKFFGTRQNYCKRCEEHRCPHCEECDC